MVSLNHISGPTPAVLHTTAVSPHEITLLIHDYGLLVVLLATGLQALGLPVPGGTAVMVAAIDASTRNGLPLGGVIAAGALGATAGTTLGFGLGRWGGEPVLMRMGRLLRRRPERIRQLRQRLREQALLPLFLARFITGARNAAGLVAGATGLALLPFLLVSAAAAVIWSAMIALEYYFAGHAILGAPTWLQVVLVLVGILATIASLRLLRPETLERLKGAVDSPDAAE
jgi:membrane protein DedA with SNARE-associated domain